MKRAFAISALVLVLLLGGWARWGEQEPNTSVGLPEAGAWPIEPPAPGLQPSAPAAVAPSPRVPASPYWPRNVTAPLTAVAPHVASCVADCQQRPAVPVQVRVIFTPLADGGFAPGTRVTVSSQDPFLKACVEDVFDEVGFVPLGAEREEPVTHDFDF